MQTVFHVSSPRAAEISVPKVENLLADDTLDVHAVAVVLDAGEAIATLERDADVAADVAPLLDRGVRYAACSNALRSPAVDGSELLDGVDVVSSGVGELTRLQADGYAYVRL
jgi:intracellular sulfur oxidation DsrE/DsrF family protein